MPSLEGKLPKLEPRIRQLEGSRSKSEYSLVYGSHSVQRRFAKAYERIPKHYVELIKEALARLKINPRQEGIKLKAVLIPVPVADCIAQFRLRVGPYRVMYDIDEGNRKVVLLFIGRRNERTYKTR